MDTVHRKINEILKKHCCKNNNEIVAEIIQTRRVPIILQKELAENGVDQILELFRFLPPLHPAAGRAASRKGKTHPIHHS